MKKLLRIVVLGLLLSGNAYSQELPRVKIFLKNENQIHVAVKHTANASTAIETAERVASDHCQTYKKAAFKIKTPMFRSSKLEKHYKKQGYPIGKMLAGTHQAWEFICSKNMISVAPSFAFMSGQQINWNNYASLQQQKITTSNTSTNSNAPKVNIALMIDRAKDTCKSLGFKEGTEKFADCSLKLYSQSVELAAEQNKQVVMQPQSSGSNVITIYDPVRDSNALMNKGMKMLSGKCTLGIDC
tara:strand:+ start:942 stop:1670 length:729 start_codon:yes stop_codon:yes gene_type:complete